MRTLGLLALAATSFAVACSREKAKPSPHPMGSEATYSCFVNSTKLSLTLPKDSDDLVTRTAKGIRECHLNDAQATQTILRLVKENPKLKEWNGQ